MSPTQLQGNQEVTLPLGVELTLFPLFEVARSVEGSKYLGEQAKKNTVKILTIRHTISE
jgi:hypothetical protein